MKIDLPAGLQVNLRDFFQKQGYHPVPLPGDESYVKRLTRDFYPRFHVYVKDEYLDLHLDQKKVSYAGSHAHSGEYDSEVVNREGERLQTEITSLIKKQIAEFNKEQKENSKFT